MAIRTRSYKVLAAGAIAALAFTSLGTGAYFGALFSPMLAPQALEKVESDQAIGSKLSSQIERDRPGIPSVAEAMVSGSDPPDEQERKLRDLAAQESMAVWSFWLLVASIVGTLAAVVGTGLLLWTLHETRQASRRELRAYLSFGELGLSVFQSREIAGGLRLELETSIKNGGATPAYECLHMGNTVVFSETEAAEYFSKSNQAPRIGTPVPYTVHNGREVPASIYSSQDLKPNEIEAIQSQVKSLYAYGEVVYRDTFGYQRVTRFCFVLDSPLLPKKPDPSGVTTTRLTWGLAPFHNDAN